MPLEFNHELWINKLLVVCIVMALLALLLALTISKLSNNDIWQHLKNGQIILETRRFQYHDPYSCSAEGTPWMNEPWFSGVVFYIIYALCGVNGIIYLKSLSIILMVALVLITCHRLKIDLSLSVPLTVLMIFNVGVRFLARNEIFVYIFIAAYFLILTEYKYRHAHWRVLIMLPVIQIFWSNMHGSFIVGLFIVAIFICSEALRLCRDRVQFKRLGPVCIVFLITLCVCMLNPYGYRLYFQPFKVVFSHSDFIKNIYEWKSPFESSVFMSYYAFRYYIIWMVLLVLSFIVNIKHFDLFHFFLSAFFFIMAFKMHRNITFFTIATCPIMALNFQQAGEDYLYLPPDQKARERIGAGVKLVILILLILLVRVSYAHGYIFRKNFSKPIGLGIASNMPVKATEYIKENHIKGCCFNSYTYGTYLIFHCFPETRVIIDSRAEHVYSVEFYRRYNKALYDLDEFKSLLEEFSVEYILLKYRSQYLVAHWTYLHESSQWALVYYDDTCALYLRRLPEYAELIDRDEYKNDDKLLF
ncbi:MAG: hypothetical protein ACMUIP_13885 [bacterium]